MTRTVIQFMGAVALATTVYAADFHVAPNGNAANPGTQAAPLRTIQRAANLAHPGDDLLLRRLVVNRGGLDVVDAARLGRRPRRRDHQRGDL